MMSKVIMDKIKSLLTSKYIFWLILAIPATGLTSQFLQGNAKYGMLMHVTGEFSVRFLVISLIATPIKMLFPRAFISKWLLRNRRFFGVAAFAYSLLHTFFYLVEEPFGKVIDEFARLGIITGWVSFFIFIPLAITSTNAAIKRMGKNWKKLQRWVYLAAFMAFLHWVFIKTEHLHWGPALVNFMPVILLSLYRIWFIFSKKTTVS